jgi:hypothetical protein
VPRVAPQIEVQRSCAHPDVEAAPEESAQIESALAGSNSHRKIHARIIVELELLFIFRIACVHSVAGRRLNGQSWVESRDAMSHVGLPGRPVVAELGLRQPLSAVGNVEIACPHSNLGTHPFGRHRSRCRGSLSAGGRLELPVVVAIHASSESGTASGSALFGVLRPVQNTIRRG